MTGQPDNTGRWICDEHGKLLFDGATDWMYRPSAMDGNPWRDDVIAETRDIQVQALNDMGYVPPPLDVKPEDVIGQGHVARLAEHGFKVVKEEDA